MTMSWSDRVHQAALGLSLAVLSLFPAPAEAVTCARTVKAQVVAIDQPLMWNRLGAQNINGAVFALRQDVRNRDSGLLLTQGGAASPGRVLIRADKRPRPLVLRVAAGDCLEVSFQNLLTPVANPNNPVFVAEGQTFNLLIDDQVADRYASFHVQGMQLGNSILDDGTFVGQNLNSIAAPGETRVYTYYADKESTHLVTSHGATLGGEAGAGNSSVGLFGQVTVEPPGARIYRSDVTEEDLRLATTRTDAATGLPVLDYEARYPNRAPWTTEGKAGLPVLNTIDASAGGFEIVHTEINAVIAGPDADGTWKSRCPGAACPYPLESVGKRNPTVPNRLEPFRDFASLFHDEVATSQAFPAFYRDPVLQHTLKGVGDIFMINYGSGGIGSEIIANRLGVGPMHDCLDCSYEEFFLTSYAVGDPAMLVDIPANTGLEACAPGGANCPATALGPKATRVLFPGDVSNVHHSYTGDFTKFRNTHSGKEHHIFHLHNHQWLYNASDDNGNYLDAQAIGPGSGYTYEINFGGSGNRNKSAGDAIFHCHLYPHFAMGMWYLWRNHDVMELGTRLQVSDGPDGFHTAPFALQDGTPALGARALPDGEVDVGAPISALVPLPGKPLPPLPGRVEVLPKIATGLDGVQRLVGSVAHVIDRGVNPGFPFWIAGIEDAVGQRTTTPPLDMWAAAGGWDGGLPRHALEGVAAGGAAIVTVDRLSFDKVMTRAKPLYYPEAGTDVERTAMAFHARKFHPTIKRDLAGNVTSLGGVTDGFRTNGNGLPVGGTDAATGLPTNTLRAGGPFSPSCMDDDGVLMRPGVTGSFFSGESNASNAANPNPRSIRGSSPYNVATPRIYKGANFQYDAVLNKAGYHYPQQRIVGLWEDVMPTIRKERPGEPLVMRNNTFDCTLYSHTNLVPTKFELDDYEVETPTDIIGQHIHLPKWDLTTTDGAANGWNYEDGTLAAQAVVERIHAINAWNEAAAAVPAGFGVAPVATPEATPTTAAGATTLVAAQHPFFGTFGRADWLGARTTLQRWFFDPVVNVDGVDRGLGIIFTHDHYGPSTHQQIGLYSTVLVEPAGSKWVHNETGVALHTRPDGGPTSWQAAILTGQDARYGAYPFRGADIDGDGKNDSYREFYFEYSDFQSAYLPGVYVGANQDGTTPGPAANHANPNTWRASIKPSTEILVGPAEMFPLVTRTAPTCIGGVPRPCAEAISLDDPGTWVVNYRNEPLGMRVYDPNKLGPDGLPGMQADGQAGDLAFALQSRTDRKFEAVATFGTVRPGGRRQVMNAQPRAGDTIVAAQLPAGIGPVEPTRFPPPINQATALGGGDPFTPMMRAYFGDRIRIKAQAGGDEETHNVVVHGLKWLQSGSGFGFSPNSGWRNAQQAGISEQFTFAAPVAPLLRNGTVADYAYSMSNDQDGWWYGTWGLLRTYNLPRADLFRLPNSAVPFVVANTLLYRDGVCPLSAVVRPYDVSVVLANQVMGNEVAGTRIPVAATDRIAQMQVGGALDPAGGTLVYNPRETVINFPPVIPDPGEPAPTPRGPESGPLHDPTAMMYVQTADLDPVTGKLQPFAPVEPLVIRAAAGECLRITLRNRLPAVVPDLAGYRQVAHVLPRDVNDPQGVTQFEYNLMRPSSFVGLHPQLVHFDVERGGGVVIGTNNAGATLVAPGATRTVSWYAGDVGLVPTPIPNVALASATPVEFGAIGLSPADLLKQSNKGLHGTLVVEPAGSTWEDVDVAADRQNNLGSVRPTRASTTVNGAIRSFASVWQKGINALYKSGAPVGSVFGEGPAAEDTYEGGTYAMNYGAEPLWFRFGLAPETPLTGGHGAGESLRDIPNAHEAFSNALAGGQDPVTPVFTALRGAPVRIHLTMPSSNGRGSVFTISGHEWQRHPYVCPGSAKDGIPGRCQPSGFYPTLTGAGGRFEVGSRALGDNRQSQVLGAMESVLPGVHYDFVFPSAGGVNQVPGDYLFHDRAASGNLQGLFGILRVE